MKKYVEAVCSLSDVKAVPVRAKITGLGANGQNNFLVTFAVFHVSYFSVKQLLCSCRGIFDVSRVYTIKPTSFFIQEHLQG